MALRFLVTDKFQVTGRGPVVSGRILEGPNIASGMVLEDERTGLPVTVRGVEMHSRETPEGRVFGVLLDQAGARTVEAGSILVEAQTLAPSR